MGLLFRLSLMAAALAAPGAPQPSATRVELKGTLFVGQMPEKDWCKVYHRTSDCGASIKAPGGSPLYHAWQLFLGDVEGLPELAMRLKGKTVIVEGTVTMLPVRNGALRGFDSDMIYPPMCVRVTSMRAAEGWDLVRFFTGRQPTPLAPLPVDSLPETGR
jgi:hypothetical protein